MLVLASNAHGIVGQAAESNINKSYIGLQDINKVLSGTITDTDGQPIAGVLVSAKSAKKEAVTDINGKFELSIPENETQLKVSCVGFATTYVNLTDDSSLAITLKEDICKAEELIPIAQMQKETRQSIRGH